MSALRHYTDDELIRLLGARNDLNTLERDLVRRLEQAEDAIHDLEEKVSLLEATIERLVEVE